MACTDSYIESLLALASTVGPARARKMMGDWIVYIDEKPIITACDNLAYVKMLPQLAPLMARAETGLPYPTAKPHYILDTAHTSEAQAVLRAMLPLLPYPKRRNKKK